MALNHNASAILLLVLVVSLTGVVQRTDAESSNSSLYLLVLLPYPSSQGNPSWSGGLNVLPGVRLAVENIQSSGILSGYTLKLLERDCGCNYTNRARLSFLDSVFYSKKQIVGLIGPGCSASAVAIAPLIIGNNVSLLSIHGAGTPQLENHTKYPNSFGIFGSSHGLVDTIIALMQLRDWTKVGVLYDSSRVFQSTTHDALIHRTSNACNDTFCIYSGALTDYYFHLDQIKKKPVRIVFLLAGPALARNLLCTAYHMGMTYPTIQWVIIERLLIEFEEDVTVYYQEKMYNCSRENMTNHILNGSVFITYRLANFDENATTYANISYTQFVESYDERIETINSGNPNNHTLKPSPWSSIYYDAVWAIAIALSEARKSNTFNLTEYGSAGTRSANDTLVLQQEIHKLNFTGVSGQVRFNTATGYNERAFDISIAGNGKVKLIACYTSGSGFVHTMTNDSDGVNYYLDDEFPGKERKVPLYAIISIGLFTVLIFCLTVVFHILTVYYRNDYFIRAASMKLSQIAYIGCYLLLLTSFTYVLTEGIDLDDTTRAVLCHLTYVFCSIGFTFLFGTLCAKEWRLYRISNHYLKPGKCLSDRPLFVLIILATTGDIFINILWISLDKFEVKSDAHFDGTKNIIVKHCHAKYLLGWYLAIYGYNLFFLLLACLLAIVAQKMYIVGFQTKVVFKMTYFTLLLMGIMISIQIIFITNEHLERLIIFIFDSIILNVAVLLANLFLFFPPVYPSIYKRPKNMMSTGITLTKHPYVY